MTVNTINVCRVQITPVLNPISDGCIDNTIGILKMYQICMWDISLISGERFINVKEAIS